MKLKKMKFFKDLFLKIKKNKKLKKKQYNSLSNKTNRQKESQEV